MLFNKGKYFLEFLYIQLFGLNVQIVYSVSL